MDSNFQRSRGRVSGLMRFGLRDLCGLRLSMLSSDTPRDNRTARGSLEHGSTALECRREFLEGIGELLNCFEESNAGLVTVEAGGLESDVDLDHVGDVIDGAFALYLDIEWHVLGCDVDRRVENGGAMVSITIIKYLWLGMQVSPKNLYDNRKSLYSKNMDQLCDLSA